MDPAHKNAIVKSQVVLAEELNPMVVHLLKPAGVLTEIDIQLILAESVKFTQIIKLLTILQTKGPDAFHPFCNKIVELDSTQVHLVDKINSFIVDEEKKHKFEDDRTTSAKNSAKCKESLKAMYVERFKTTNPFSLPFTFNIEKTWVSLALKENTKHTEATEDHAKLLEQAFVKEKMLIVEGKPGTGKTSLMRRLAYEWASGKGKLELMHYDLIIYAEFRELQNRKFTHIAELLSSYLQTYVGKENSMEIQKIITDEKWFEEKHTVLVLLDGFDESSSEGQCEQLYSYLTKDTIDMHPLFNIVMTTRPGHLPAELKGQEGRFVFAEVLGFTTDEQKIKYISNHFSKHEKGEKGIIVEAESISDLLKSQEIQKLITVEQKKMYILNHFSKQTETDAIKVEALSVYFMLKSNESLCELAETPLFLTFICLVHRKIIDGKTPLLDLYCNIIWWLLDRHQKTCRDVDVPYLFGYDLESENDKLKKSRIRDDYLHFPQLQNLGNMALHNLERNHFSQSDLDRFNVHSIVQQVGLLRKEEKFDRDSITTTIEFLFMHRTIQEFLAAFSYLVRKRTLVKKIKKLGGAFSSLVTKRTQGVDNFMARDIFNRILENPATEYEKFLWRIATSDKLPISAEMKSYFFKSYSTLVLDLDIFSSSAEISFVHLKHT